MNIGVFEEGPYAFGPSERPLVAGGPARAPQTRRRRVLYGVALASIQRLEDRRKILEAEVAANAGALRDATERYQAGYTPYIGQVDAQRSLLSAQLSLAQVDTDRLLAFVTLCEAIGAGWTQTASDSQAYPSAAARALSPKPLIPSQDGLATKPLGQIDRAIGPHHAEASRSGVLP